MQSLRSLALPLLLLVPGLASDKHVDFDQSVDFSRYRTYSLKRGTNTARPPELNNAIVSGKIDNSIRQQLNTKNLEESKRPDLFIEWHFGAATKKQVFSWPTGRYGLGTHRTTSFSTEGTLVIDFVDAATKELIWRGVNRDDKSKPAELSRRIEKDVKELLDRYPPKVKN